MSERAGCLLAEIPNFGRVYDCGDCGNIHVTVGPVSVTLSPDAYIQLATLIHTSAANFEVWLQNRNGAAYEQRQPEEEELRAERDIDPNPA